MDPATLLASKPSLDMTSSALGGTQRVDQTISQSTGAFNVGGASLNNLFLIGGAVALFFIWKKFRK